AGARPRAARELLRAATPWQRRRNLLVAIAVVLALATGVLLTPGLGGAGRVLALSFAGMSLAGAAFGAVTADAVADAMQGAPATLPPLAVPARLLAALLTGLALMFALLSGLLAVGGGGFRMLTILLVLGVLAAATQWLDGRHARRDGRAAAGPAGRPAWWPWLLLAGVPGLALATASLGVGGIAGWLSVVALASFAGSLVAVAAAGGGPGPGPGHGLAGRGRDHRLALGGGHRLLRRKPGGVAGQASGARARGRTRWASMTACGTMACLPLPRTGVPHARR